MINTDLNQILDFLKSCGINIKLINDAANNNIFLLCFSFTLLAFIALLSLININIYLLILYFSKHKKIVKLVSKRQITLILFTLFNMGVPLSLNFLGEFLSLSGIFQKNPIIGILGATGIFFSACYSI